MLCHTDTLEYYLPPDTSGECHVPLATYDVAEDCMPITLEPASAWWGEYGGIYWTADTGGLYHFRAMAVKPPYGGDTCDVYVYVKGPQITCPEVDYTAHPDLIDGGTSGNPDYGLSGCGAFIEQNTLIPLSRDDGYNLFCDYIKNGNNNLPTIYDGYSYDDICGDGINEGQLIKETAKVYCDDKTLTWEDPAGDYKVAVYAKDTAGNFSYTDLEDNDTIWEAGERNFNYFEYLPFLGFEVDFDKVNYGENIGCG